MKKDTLAIFPSRGRADRIEAFYDSWRSTTSGRSEVVVRLDIDDPMLSQYKRHPDVKLEIGDRIKSCRSTNELFKKYPNYKYYALLGDDAVIKTKNWEDILIETIETKGEGWGYASANDLVRDDGSLLSFGIISGNIPRALGYFLHPSLIHMFADNLLMETLKEIDGYFYEPKVVIEHIHWVNGKAHKDKTYQEADDTWGHDEEQYKLWQQNQKNLDIQKLKEAMWLQ